MKLPRGQFKLAQVICEKGGWAYGKIPTPKERREAERRWVERSYRRRDRRDDGLLQCGGCRYFAAFGADYGVCWNEKSRADGMIVFEHGGCKEHSEAGR